MAVSSRILSFMGQNLDPADPLPWSSLRADSPPEDLRRPLRAWMLERADQLLSTAPPRLHLPGQHDRYRPLPGQPHHFTPELFLLLRGRHHFHCGRQHFTLEPGEIGLIPRGVPHAEHFEPVGGRFLCMVWMFSNQQTSVHIASRHPGELPRIIAPLRYPMPQTHRFISWLEDVADLHRGALPGGRQACNRLLATTLLALGSLLENGPADAARKLKRGLSPKVQQCRLLIHEHLADPQLSVQKLAEALHCSADYLSFLFHEQSGETIIHFIHRRRIEHARYLLAESRMNISEIARASGFADAGYFSRIFRRLTGLAPRAYRHLLQP